MRSRDRSVGPRTRAAAQPMSSASSRALLSSSAFAFSRSMSLAPRLRSAHELGLLPRPPVELGLCLLTLDVLGPTPALLVLGPLESMGHALGIVLRVDGLLLVMLSIPLRILVGLV